MRHLVSRAAGAAMLAIGTTVAAQTLAFLDPIPGRQPPASAFVKRLPAALYLEFQSLHVEPTLSAVTQCAQTGTFRERFVATVLLGHLGDRTTVPLLKGIIGGWELDLHPPEPPRSIEESRWSFKGDSYYTRARLQQFALHALKRIADYDREVGTPEMREYLVAQGRRQLESADNLGTREYAANELATMGDSSGYQVVLQSLQDQANSAPAERFAPAFAKFSLKDKDGKPVDWVTPLVAILGDETLSETRRFGAAHALRQMNTPESREALLRYQASMPDGDLKRTLVGIPLRPDTTPGPPTAPRSRNRLGRPPEPLRPRFPGAWLPANRGLSFDPAPERVVE